jgi:hypothetical protein
MHAARRVQAHLALRSGQRMVSQRVIVTTTKLRRFLNSGLRLSSASVVGNAKCLSGERLVHEASSTGLGQVTDAPRDSQPVCAPFCGCRRALDLLIWPSFFLGSLGQTRAHPRAGDRYVSVAFVFVRSRSANDDKREEGLGETRVCHVFLASRVRHCISSSSERHVKRPTMDLSCLSKAICTTVNAT